MQNPVISTQGNQVILDKNSLLMWAIAVALVLLIVVIIVVAAKTRKKGFIKTLPTNLKDER